MEKLLAQQTNQNKQVYLQQMNMCSALLHTHCAVHMAKVSMIKWRPSTAVT